MREGPYHPDHHPRERGEVRQTVGLEEQPSAATGTAMRADTLREYAAGAGFSRFEVLPIENDFWRFYRLEG